MINMFSVEEIKSKFSIAIGPQTYKALKEKSIEAHVSKNIQKRGFLKEIIEIYNNYKKSEENMIRRGRRLRANAAIRDLVRENKVNSSDFIFPILLLKEKI